MTLDCKPPAASRGALGLGTGLTAALVLAGCAATGSSGDVAAAIPAPDDLQCVQHYWTLAILLPPETEPLASARLREAAIAHSDANPGGSEVTLRATVQPPAQARARRIYEKDEPAAALERDLAACDARYGFEPVTLDW